jgi:PAS domain S-box-containing protein
MATTMNDYSILIVEDNQDLVMGLQDLLHHDGYAVTAAGTVAAAIKLVRAHRFNAILLDLGLPDGDGLEVLKESQRLDPSLPVVIVTAHISSDRTVGTLAQGAYAYLTKPYDREELRHTLRRAIGVKELAVKVEQTERLLSQSEERLELVIQGSHDGFWDGQVLPGKPWSSPSTPVWWSPHVKSMLGYTDEEFPDVLESWASRLHDEDRDRVFAALTAHIERRDPYDEEYRLLTKAGEYRWFRARGQAIWDETGRVTRMSGSLRDVTDRKQAEDALRRNEQLLQNVINNTTAVIYVKYTDGRYLLTNRRFEQLFHLTTDQIVGHTDHEIFPKDIADAFRANDVTVSERNSAVEYEEYAPHSDGLHAYISIKFPLCDHTGKPYATCGISTDITERKSIEHNLRSLTERLHLALTSTKLGTWNWNLQTGHIYWSAQVDRFLDLSDGARPHTKYDWLALVYPEDRESMTQAMRQAMVQPGTDVAFEHRVLRSDGNVSWCIWTGEIIRDQDGKAVHILGAVCATDDGAGSAVREA